MVELRNQDTNKQNDAPVTLEILPETAVATPSSEFFTDVHIHVTDEEFEDNDEIGGDKRQPLYLVAVIDKSGSMSGKKLEQTKKTLEFLIEEMKGEDQLTIVSYDSKVYLDLKATKMDKEGKKSAQKISRGYRAGSCTNLSGALQRAVLSVPADLKSTAAILLMTDGMANVGITSASGISACVDSLFNKPEVGRCPIHTFGYGKDHDSTFLRDIAANAEGMYYFVENDDQIVDGFADCLAGLLTTRCQSVLLDIEALQGKINKVMTKRTVETVKEGKHYRVTVGDLQLGEDRDVVVSMDLSSLPDTCINNNVDLIKASMSYYDVSTEKMGNLSFSLTTSFAKTTSEPANERVLEQKLRVQVTETMNEAMELGDGGKLKEGQTKLNKMATQLEKSSLASNKFCMDWVSELRAHAGNMDTTQVYQKKGKHQMHATTYCVEQQRAANMCSEETFSFAQKNLETKARMCAKKKAARWK